MQTINISFDNFQRTKNIHHFELRSFFENKNLLASFIPHGKINTEPEIWAIDCNDIENDSTESYQYDSKIEYEGDVQFLEALAMKIDKGNDYSFTNLEKYAEVHGFSIECHGKDIIGEHFTVLKTEKDQTITFIYTSYNQEQGGFYTCIYSDFKEDDRKQYFVFGDQASKTYLETNSIDEIINEGIEIALHAFDPENKHGIDNLLEAFDGWGGYAQIDKEDYETLLNHNPE
jgi:hypothetical protein